MNGSMNRPGDQSSSIYPFNFQRQKYIQYRRDDNIKMYVKETGLGARTGIIWVRLGTSGGLLLMR